jgi:hypothetical protein
MCTGPGRARGPSPFAWLTPKDAELGAWGTTTTDKLPTVLTSMYWWVPTGDGSDDSVMICAGLSSTEKRSILPRMGSGASRCSESIVGERAHSGEKLPRRRRWGPAGPGPPRPPRPTRMPLAALWPDGPGRQWHGDSESEPQAAGALGH